jgi:drug/metabolite transporter (DMT)-like permease
MQNAGTRQRLIAIFSLVLILLSMSFGTILMKMVLFEVKPLTLTWLSVLVGMIVMTLYTFVIRREKVPHGLEARIWGYIIVIGLCNFVISRISRPFALERLPAITTTFLGNFIGFITMGMSVFILKEKPSVYQLLGAVVAVTGLTIYFEQIPTDYELVGVALILVGIIAVAYTNNIARKFAIITDFKFSNSMLSTLALLIGGVITVGIGLALDWPPQVGSLRNWGIIFYVGIVMIGVGLTGWNYFLRVLRSYEASILGATSVIWTAILAWIFLGEALSWFQIGGIALLLVGLMLVQVRGGWQIRSLNQAGDPVQAANLPLIIEEELREES